MQDGRGKAVKRMSIKKRNRGFSLIELVVVIAIILVISAVAIPNAIEGVYDLRLRSAGTSVAGLMQQARQMAIKDNTFYPIKFTTQGSTVLAYIDASPTTAARTSSTTPYDSTFPTVQLGGTIAKTFSNPDTSGTSTPWAFSPMPMALKPYWGPMGLPCAMSSGRCVTSVISGAGTAIVGYQVILTDARSFGSPGFVSVTASPGGRVRVWHWSGGVWQ